MVAGSSTRKEQNLSGTVHTKNGDMAKARTGNREAFFLPAVCTETGMSVSVLLLPISSTCKQKEQVYTYNSP